ncbi:PREDICTED: protein dispatched isoform X2 [Polistes dominula]|uniref:Protein dispatched isoform X2 n=1 Tax=Polistes dominula TaxID=743375 RepID=A0ABM1IQB3_POLDO|nr:PREDICTED: protein dispatched isoform X2 [Polistes dominula]
MEAWWFSRIVAHHPCVILLTVFLFSCTCLIAPRTIEHLPDFSDPQLGFEARGTVLAQRLTAWQNLMKATEPRGEFTNNPFEYNYYLEQIKEQTDSIPQNHSWASQGILDEEDTSNNNDKDKWKELSELRSKNQFNIIDYDKSHNNLDSESFFCNLPNPNYARVVIGSTETEEKSLWTMEGVLAQCHIDAALRANPHFTSLCQVEEEHNGIKSNQKCCRSWSPANYVALLSNRSSCLGVTEDDLIRVEALLRRCAYYYYNLELTSNCAEDTNCQKRVRAECYQHNAVYHLLHYLLDFNFIPNDKHQFVNKSHLGLQSAMLFLPMAAGSASLDFYKDLNNNGLSYGKFKVQGMQLGLKSTLFDRLLVSNFSLVLTGFGFVTLCIWMYTGSLLLTIATFFAVLFSLGISYAVYTLVLQIKFFPFMNLLAIVVAVGIGADDAFIYCKVWECCKQQKLTNDGLPRLVQETMKHAVPSMFVTSLTTAVAFFASIVSNVTAINCFSLFSGMTVIANFFLMITWLPACVVVSERCRITTLSPASFITRKIIRPVRLFADKVALTFSTFLTKIAIGLRWFWLLSLGALATACCIVVFYNPGLQLPDTPDFQLFESSHPFEQYDLIYSQQFLFEKREMIDDGEALPMRFVWGIKPIDNGDYLNPDKKGELEWDDSFDVSHPKSQLWLQEFCYNLRLQPFYRSTLGALLQNCFIESLQKWMERQCKNPINESINYSPCCKKSTFPYKPKVLRKCAAEAAAHVYVTPSNLWRRDGPVYAGLKFLKNPVQTSLQGTNATRSLKLPLPKIKALVIEYNSIYNYSLSYSDMDQFYNQVETWMQKQLKTAPPTMQGGWFVSELEFYELQRTLHEGTIWAMVVSLVLALAVLVFVTLNPLVSMYAIITIGAAIIVTVAALILLGWKLNVLESVAVSTAIGLAVDFSLHYAVSYRACNSEQRMDKVKATLNQMGGPTLMAALTSGIAGALMLPSDVLAYIQIGIFLLLVMGISWIYATLFLCPMLAVIGPSSHFAQFQYPRGRKLLFCFRKKKSEDLADNRDNGKMIKKGKGRGMLYESTLSTSSTVCQFHCSEPEILIARPPSSSLPPSPTSALLYLDST